jgi:hypothetical protein
MNPLENEPKRITQSAKTVNSNFDLFTKDARNAPWSEKFAVHAGD